MQDVPVKVTNSSNYEDKKEVPQTGEKDKTTFRVIGFLILVIATTTLLSTKFKGDNK